MAPETGNIMLEGPGAKTSVEFCRIEAGTCQGPGQALDWRRVYLL